MDQRSQLSPPSKPTWRRRALRIIAGLAVLCFLVAYILIPFGTQQYAHHHPAFDNNTRITNTGDGHPGDPLNVALIGTQEQIEAVLLAAQWKRAAALGLKSDLKIGVDTVLSRPDDKAPVSNLFLYGRKEDLAFERPVGSNPRQRNHVRFWKMEQIDEDGRPIWIGAASYDERVGLSHTTGQITHHISGDVDKERDYLFVDLKKTGGMQLVYAVDRFHQQLEGRNGGGDRWFTDGRLLVGVIAPADAAKNTQ
jgi:hypothetical protein